MKFQIRFQELEGLYSKPFIFYFALCDSFAPHTPYAKKNQTDHVASVPHIGLRYMIAFIYPITATIKPFLASKGHNAEEVEKMHQAWFKSVTPQVTLWVYPYAKDNYF